MQRISLVERAITRDLRGAQVIALVQIGYDEHPREGKGFYEEWSFIVAWEREDQFGTHRVQVNNDGESMCISGVYDIVKREDALLDFIERSQINTMAHSH